MTRYFSLLIFIVSIVLIPFTTFAQSQSDTTPQGVGEDVAEALGEQRGQSEEEQLEQILSSEESNYSLIKSGNFKLDYSFNYSVNTSIRPRQAVQSGTATDVTVFNLTTDSQHTANHRVSMRYGYYDFLTLGMNLPVVTKWNSTSGEATGGLGDVSFTSRYDPFVSRPGQASLSLSSSLSVPTGRSPWEINQDEELSTGSGGFNLSTGVNVSKTVDPVVAFGNFGLSYGLPITGLDQFRGSRGAILREVHPGPGFSLGMGMAYSLSYDVSLTMSFNYSLSLPTELIFETGRNSGNFRTVETSTQASGIFSISTGWRLSPQYIANVGVGIGLTESSPDMNINVGFPLVLNTDLL
jgi:hypothetical protein